MKKILQTLLILFCCLSTLTCPIQAKELTEYERYYAWLETLPSQDEAIFEMKADMYVLNSLQSIDTSSKELTTIQTNGFHIYIMGKDCYFDSLKIIGDQDTLVIINEGNSLRLYRTTILNESNTAVQLQNQSTIIGDGPTTTSIHGEPAIRYDGDITISTLSLQGTYACKGTGSILADGLYAKGITQANSIQSTYSYFESEETTSHQRLPFSIGYPEGIDLAQTKDLYVDVISSCDLQEDVVSTLQPSIRFLPTTEGITKMPYLDMSCDLIWEDEKLQLMYDTYTQDILSQNTSQYQYVSDFQQPTLHVTYFDDYVAKVQVNDYFGYYAIFEFPPYYGAQALYVEYSTDQINWETERYQDELLSDYHDTHIYHMVGTPMERLQTYYYRYRIEGGLYDGYESDVITLPIINSYIDKEFSLPAYRPNQNDGLPTLPPTITLPPDIDYGEEEMPKDPEPIVGNEGQGGGRGESNYEPSDTQEKPVPKPDIQKPITNPKDETTPKQESTSQNTKQETTYRVVETIDQTQLLCYSLMSLLSLVLLLYGYQRLHQMKRRS